MLKLLFVGRRAGGTSRRAAQRHLMHVHGRMVVLPPVDAGAMPADYVQHHVLDGAYPTGDAPQAIERDLVTALTFDDLDHLRASTATPYYRERLMPDEPRFVDNATVAKMRAEPQVLHDGAGGDYKLFAFVTQGPGDLDAAARADAAALAARGFGRVVVNRLSPLPGAEAFADLALEAWHADAGEVRGALDAIAGMALFGAADPARSVALAVEAFSTQRLRALLG